MDRNWWRSSSAANSSSASGLTLPSRARSRSARAARFSWVGRWNGPGCGATTSSPRSRGLLVLGHLDRAAGGHRLVGAVLGDQRVDLDAVLLDRALLELLDAQPLLGPHHLVAVDGVGQPRQLLGQFAAAGAHARAARPRARPGRCWAASRSAAAAATDAPMRGERPGGRRRAPRAATTAPRARARAAASWRAPGGPLASAARSSCSARPASARTRSSPVRTASRASISACRAAATSACSASRSPVSGSCRLVGLRLGQVQPLLEVGQAGEVAVAGRPRRRRAPVEPLGLGGGRAGRLAELGELLGHRGQPGVGLVQRGQRALDLGLQRGGALARPRRARRAAGRAARRPRRPSAAASSTAAWISIALGATADPPLDPAGAEDVAGAGDRARRPGRAGDQARAAVEVGDDGDPVEQRRRRPAR